jgi:deoxycytidylate deaminase
MKPYVIAEPKIQATERHRRFLNIAKKFAKRSEFPTAKMACVLTRGGRVISVGVNKERSGSLKHRAYTRNQAHHAELDSCYRVDPKLLRGATLYVAGFTKSGLYCWSSRPCPSCIEMLKSFGVKMAIFHDNMGNIYSLKF